MKTKLKKTLMISKALQTSKHILKVVRYNRHMITNDVLERT